MTVAPRSVEFWYDFNSPNSHPVAQVIGRRAADLGVTVAWRPFRVAPIERRREEMEDMPPADGHEVEHLFWRNFVHACDQAGVQGLRPTMFPKDSIPALRAAVACELEGLDAATFVRAAFDACYAKDWDIADPTVLGEVLGWRSTTTPPACWSARAAWTPGPASTPTPPRRSARSSTAPPPW